MPAEFAMIRMNTTELALAVGGTAFGAETAFTGAGTDTRKLQGGELFIALRGERFDGHDFLQAARDAGARAVLVEHQDSAALPGVVVRDTRRAMGGLAAAWRGQFSQPLVAITGSNGKTTVKEMLRSILGQCGPVLSTQGNLNNDIGVPLTLFGLDTDYHYAVIEMGANHPGEIDYLTRIAQPDIAVVTQCAPAHLEGFGSIEGVARAKGEIFAALPPHGTAIINADDVYAPLWRQLAGGRRILSFGLVEPADVTAGEVEIRPAGGSRFQLQTPAGEVDIDLPLPGRHNVMNALAAAAAALGLDITAAQIAAGLGNLRAVAGRLVQVEGLAGSTVLDDTYNANPGSLAAALEVLVALPGRPWLVLGDMGELGPQAAELHAEAGRQARSVGVERLYAVGELSRHAAEAFGAGAAHFPDMEALVARLRQDIGAGVVALVKGSRSSRMERAVAALREAN